MPKITQNASDKTNGDLSGKLEGVVNTVVGVPTVTVGVQRKANIGNFETIDIYCAVSMPVSDQPVFDEESLRSLVSDAAKEGFLLASKETGERYELIKDALKNK